MWEWEEPGTLGISNSWPLCPEPRAPNSYHFGPSLPQTVTRSPSAPEPAPGSPPREDEGCGLPSLGGWGLGAGRRRLDSCRGGVGTAVWAAGQGTHCSWGHGYNLTVLPFGV